MRKFKTQLYIPVDLAAVCSVAFIMLLFYVGMGNPKPQDPVEINLPETSGYMCTLNTLGDAIVLIGEDKVFLYLPDTIRTDVLKQIGSKYDIAFTQSTINRFKSLEFIDMPIVALNAETFTDDQAGININGQNNELSSWINAANQPFYSVYKRHIRIGIKADKNTGYPLIKSVIAAMQSQNINKFAFITATKANMND